MSEEGEGTTSEQLMERRTSDRESSAMDNGQALVDHHCKYIKPY